MSAFSAWRGEAHARWTVGHNYGECQAACADPLRALNRLRRRLPRSVGPRRLRLYQLCWDAVRLHTHGDWITRDQSWLYPGRAPTVDQIPSDSRSQSASTTTERLEACPPKRRQARCRQIGLHSPLKRGAAAPHVRRRHAADADTARSAPCATSPQAPALYPTRAGEAPRRPVFGRPHHNRHRYYTSKRRLAASSNPTSPGSVAISRL
jgi:hypothetical protein